MERIGYLVPAGDFDGEVHSVFQRACNIACVGSLITLTGRGIGNGPTTLQLGRDAPSDLRLLFRAGDRVLRRGGTAQVRGVALHLGHASRWCPAPPQPFAPEAQIAINLRHADAALRRHRDRQSSVIDRDATTVLTALEEATRELDAERALPHVLQLIGWGEGLTPAGDDYLVGWCAALRALAGADDRRARFVGDVGAAVAAQTLRTTAIAAHYLQLATQGHFNADVHALRDAMLCGQDFARLQRALADALAVGATSGADTVAGLVTGCHAWLCPTGKR